MRKRLVGAIVSSTVVAAAGFNAASVAQEEDHLLNYVVASDRLHTSG